MRSIALVRYPDPAFPGQLAEDGIEVRISHICTSPKSTPLHLPATVGENPEDTVMRALRRSCHLLSTTLCPGFGVPQPAKYYVPTGIRTRVEGLLH